MKILSKIFSLSDMKYYWLLILSIIVCAVFFYRDRMNEMNTSNEQMWFYVGYGISFGLAILWSVANYIGHIRINALYRKQQNIQAYVEQLAMSAEEKTELRNYLEDYAQDLMSQGKTKEQATAEAISQFKVKELLSLSKNTALFHLHAHYYLLGWAIIAFILLGLVGIWDSLVSSSLPTFIVEMIFLAYGSSLMILFFIYKLLDALIYKKLFHHLES